MVFPKTTRTKHFAMYEHDAILKEDPLDIKKVKMPFSFMLEDQIYTTFDLKRFNIFNMVTDAEKMQTVTPIHLATRKDILKVNILIEWKWTFALPKGEKPAAGYPLTFTTTIVTPANFVEEDVTTMFSREWQCIIADTIYFYVPGSIRKVKGRSS